MNIIINFDFFNAIRDVNENFLGFKIIRNNKRIWIKYNLPIYTTLDFLFLKDNPNKILLALLFQMNLAFGIDLFECLLKGEDIYKKEAIIKLKKLIPLLERINLETTYDLLLKSECYDKITNFKINENKLPELVESKYILVPAFDYNGTIIDESILQEHVIGSNTYTLSKGSPSKVLKLAYKRA